MTMRAYALLPLCAAACTAALVDLPGRESPMLSKMHAGYVDAGVPPSGRGRMMFHYIAFESETDPANAPTVFWYNGGPGASSLFGTFQELGPFFLDADSERTEKYAETGIPTPRANPYSWTKRFNLIALDSPPPIGMSYCTEHGPAGDGYSCGNWTDEAVFKANHAAVTAVMHSEFPQWIKNDLYITGESYAGVYVPGLVNEFLDQPNGLNLKGFAVGDGCMGVGVTCQNLTAGLFDYPSTWAGPWYDLQFFGGHGQISNELFKTILKDCPETGLRSGQLSQHCWALIEEMKKEVGGFFVYDLYDDCPKNVLGAAHGKNTHGAARRAFASKQAQRRGAAGYVCPGTAFADYFNNAAVREAMHLPKDINFFNSDNGKGFPYQETMKDVRPIYVRAARAGLKVLTYEGDADASGLSSVGLQDIYNNLWAPNGFAKTEAWRSWVIDSNVVGGYVIEWGASIAHVTVRGSGHMVPLNKPAASFEMINAFIASNPYPAYNTTR
eukprot:TRINITY_DN1819_c0_g2_i3.p2 TRINITY_DN1819_c0_g2~~TRINITY_DN1819_c0_g2_i3.p2  ORF type:complete len:498 (+),score=201.11 TRINITY_DN1819_c0_g2_i3:65-1558(+)